MDDEWTGLGLYRALHRTSHSPHGTHELSAAATSTSPESQATCWHLCSVTIFKPLFPHSMLPSTTLHRLSALRRISKAPLCSVRRYNPVSPQTPDPWTPTNRQSTAYFDNNRTLLNGSIRWALSATKQYSYYYSWSSDSVKAVDGRTPSGPNSWAQGQGKS